ncbi:MAG: hypothetical protein O3B01_24605 [Planctomycetota bacterium]|nr:hypothetical protein [Planctomycetota bacterium]
MFIGLRQESFPDGHLLCGNYCNPKNVPSATNPPIKNSILNRLPIVLLAAALAGPAAAERSIRLADAGWEPPLEYWTKDVELPDGGRMFFRGPETVFIDGKALECGCSAMQ